ncbi:hypothetical protein RESH_04309 [Rhodopirellula europaea SH398]|uniref:Uncharacterized protein n=3 Tax=Rhodopirellula TaxID=265488 RepID=M5S0J7_9BACT|nr:hypothetical protein RESH_04309 [Rhodopirellula europaea SH398]
MKASSWLMNLGSRALQSRWSEFKDLVELFMASVPGEVFGLLTKNTHWDTDAVFLQ